MRPLITLSRTIDRITGGLGALIGWLTLAMIAIGAFNAAARYFDARQLVDVRLSSNAFIELQWYLFSGVFLLGAGYALRQGAHVRVDVLYGRLSKRAQAYVDVAGTLLFLLPFAVFVVIMSWPAIENSWAVREQSPDPGGLPRYPIKALIPLAFGLLIIQSVSELIKRIAFLTGYDDVNAPNSAQDTHGGAHSAAASHDSVGDAAASHDSARNNVSDDKEGQR